MTDAELALLSILSESPHFDHELNAIIEERGLRRWTAIGNSSMYYVLDKLERQGLVEVISNEHGHRKVGMSSAGYGVLQTAVSDLLSTPHAHDKSFELGLANLHVLKPHQIRTALLSRQQDLSAQIKRVTEESAKAGSNFQINALFAHNIDMLRAELAWVDKFIQDWETHTPAEPEPFTEPSIAPRMKQVILPQDADSVHKETTREANPNKRSTPPSSPTMLFPDNPKTD